MIRKRGCEEDDGDGDGDGEKREEEREVRGFVEWRE